MKIVLDQAEITNILMAWAKTKYHTHNVSVERLTGTDAMLMVTPNDEEYGHVDIVSVPKVWPMKQPDFTATQKTSFAEYNHLGMVNGVEELKLGAEHIISDVI